MSDPAHPQYATVAQVKQWAPYSARDFPDPSVPDVIESASREVIAKTNKEWDITDPAYDDIEIITSYLAGSMIQATLGNVEKSKWYRELGLSKLKTLIDTGGGPGGDLEGDTINVFSSARSYYLASSVDPSQTIIKPFKSRY